MHILKMLLCASGMMLSGYRYPTNWCDGLPVITMAYPHISLALIYPTVLLVGLSLQLSKLILPLMYLPALVHNVR